MPFWEVIGGRVCFFFFSSRRRHTRYWRDWSSDVCSSDLLYIDPAAAERGIRRFRDSGYEGERIGIISRDREDAKEVAENTGASAATGAATGAVAGGLLGGLTGLLIGIGALAIPGIGPVVAGGALASAFGIGGGTAV